MQWRLEISPRYTHGVHSLSSQNTSALSQWRKKIVRLGLCGGAIVSAIVLSLMIRTLGGEPFRMTIEPDDGHAMVQFVRPDAGLISESFRVNIACERREEIALDSVEVEIPGGEIEFADTTLLPGRFMI